MDCFIGEFITKLEKKKFSKILKKWKFETSSENKRLQTIKEQIIIGLQMGKKIDIEKEEKK